MATTVAFSGLAGFELAANSSTDLLTIPPGSYGNKPYLFYCRAGLPSVSGPFNFPNVNDPVLTYTDTSVKVLNKTRLVNPQNAEASAVIGQGYILTGTVLDQGGVISLSSGAPRGTGAAAYCGMLIAVVVSWDSSTVPNAAVAGNFQVCGTGMEDTSGDMLINFFPNFGDDSGVRHRPTATSPFAIICGHLHSTLGAPPGDASQDLSTAIWINDLPLDASYATSSGVAFGSSPVTGEINWNSLSKPNWHAIAGATGFVTHIGVTYQVSGETSIDFGGLPYEGVAATATARGWAAVIG